MMNAEVLEQELLKYGYTGRLTDLIKYAGSLEALEWYWKNILLKLLKKSNNFYGGGFIRFKVKEEAFKKFQKHCHEVNEFEKARENERLRRQHIKKQDNAFFYTLNSWFTNYEKQTDKEQQFDDIQNFVEYSGYFDYMDYSNKNKLLCLESPVYMNSIHRRLFYNYHNSLNAY